MNNICDINEWIDRMTDTTSTAEVTKKKLRREKTTSRKEELSRRKLKQFGRVGLSRMVGVTADVNRRTGEVHEHNRSKERNRSNRKFISN